MAAGKPPAPVTGTITTGLVSCSIAILTVLLHGPQSLEIAAASFGLASLVRGVYTVARAFDRWQGLQLEQGRRDFQMPLPPECSDASLVATSSTTRLSKQDDASQPLIAPPSSPHDEGSEE